MNKLSVVILTHNDAHMIAGAIESALWADEIVVIDNASTDETRAIAEGLGARVVPAGIFKGFGALRNLAAETGSHDWIFSLDADERMTPAVRDEVLALLASEPASDAYQVPRRNWFMGQWIKGSGWYPDYRAMQLFRKQTFRYKEEAVHEGYVYTGKQPIGRLENPLLHFSYENLDEVLSKASLFSTLGAEKMGAKKVSMGSALGHALWTFIRMYLIKGGIRDGWAGFVIALSNFETTFYRYAKLYESRHPEWRVPVQAPITRDSR
jgi:glycosyltransferase involved in cell wall biosynthesis